MAPCEVCATLALGRFRECLVHAAAIVDIAAELFL